MFKKNQNSILQNVKDNFKNLKHRKDKFNLQKFISVKEVIN